MANDISEIKPYDCAVNNRVRVISYPKVFVEDEPKNKFEIKMDKNLDNEMLTVEFQEALVFLTINRYFKFLNEEGGIEHEPEQAMKGKEDWISDQQMK